MSDLESQEKIKENLFNYINIDLKSLIKHLKEQDKLKKIFIKEQSFSIDQEFFKNLVNKYCLKSKLKTLKNRKLNNRLNLFKKVFFSNLNYNKIQIITFKFAFDRKLPKISDLFYLFYYENLKRKIQSSKNLITIFSEILKEWEEAFNKKKLPVLVKVLFPKSRYGENIRLDSKIEILINHSLIHIIDFVTSKIFEYLNLIVYTVNIPFNYYEGFPQSFENFLEDGIKYENQWKENIETKIDNIICSLFSVGIKFKIKDIPLIIELPWWLKSEVYEDYKKLDEIYPPFPNILQKSEIEKFKKNYEKIWNNEIFRRKQYSIIKDRYLQVHNADIFIDKIINAIIFYEMFFTRGIEGEMRFRFSINGALFLSKNLNEFTYYYNFFWETYDLRQKILHGGNWRKKLRKIIRLFPKIMSQFDLIKELNKLLMKCIIKLLDLKKSSSNPLNLFEKLYFFEQSILNKKNK